MIRFDDRHVHAFLSAHELEMLAPQIAGAHRMLARRDGPGAEFLGWLEPAAQRDRDTWDRIQHAARRLRDQADVVVVIGIGGSYLGARAAIEMLTPAPGARTRAGERPWPQIVFCGHHLSASHMAELMDWLEDREVAVNVISKSGTTTEPAIAFRVLRAFMERKYGTAGARERILVTTDRARGALRDLADAQGYESFVVPDDIGGRYSVLTPVGLLPIAAAGIDIQQMMAGASACADVCDRPRLADNPAYRYAAVRNALLRRGYSVEILANYEPALHSLGEWWKQLFGESEGKDGKGIFPAAVDNTTDLHSMGQYIQDGRRFLFETVLDVRSPRVDFVVPDAPESGDGLDFLAGRSLHEINRTALAGTALAHVDGGVPVLRVEIPGLTAEAFGQTVYFFEKACAISGYLLGVNPFDQPGVEAYKQNMFALLGKPGFETRRTELQKRLRE